MTPQSALLLLGCRPEGKTSTRAMEAAAVLLLPILVVAVAAGYGCTTGCDLALTSFFVRQSQSLSNIAALIGIGEANYSLLAPYNPNISNLHFVNFNTSVNVSFVCRCLSLPAAPFPTYLAGSLPFRLSRGQTYTSIADNYNNLTTAEWLQATNTYPVNNITENDVVNVTVNCSCGDASISPDYGLFLTYPLRDRETLASVGASNGFSSPSQMDMLRRYNSGMDNGTGRGLVYIPVKDPSGSYRPLKPSGKGATAGAVVAGVVALVPYHIL